MLCGLMYYPVKSEKKIEKFLDENVVKKEKNTERGQAISIKDKVILRRKFKD